MFIELYIFKHSFLIFGPFEWCIFHLRFNRIARILHPKRFQGIYQIFFQQDVLMCEICLLAAFLAGLIKLCAC